MLTSITIANDNIRVDDLDFQCPPCKAFTPELVKTYKKLNEEGKNFEVVFVSSDRTDEKFKEYYGTMPWLALPLKDDRIDQLSSYFEVEGSTDHGLLGGSVWLFRLCGLFLIHAYIIFFFQYFSHYHSLSVSWWLSLCLYLGPCYCATLCVSLGMIFIRDSRVQIIEQ